MPTKYRPPQRVEHSVLAWVLLGVAIGILVFMALYASDSGNGGIGTAASATR